MCPNRAQEAEAQVRDDGLHVRLGAVHAGNIDRSRQVHGIIGDAPEEARLRGDASEVASDGIRVRHRNRDHGLGFPASVDHQDRLQETA